MGYQDCRTEISIWFYLNLFTQMPDFQGIAITGAAVVATDYVLGMSPMYTAQSRPVQLFLATAVASVGYGLLIGGTLPA